jgi:hypothetical protein
VQALIRAGASSDEAARRAGWSVEKVHRYEGPILAEREHVAGLAQLVRLRSRTGVSGDGGAPTLAARVSERLKARDVEMTDASWDSWRTEGGPWTVVLTFAAGGRQRQASWSFDVANRTVAAMDDEARWLSEEVREAKGPIPATRERPVSGRDTAVYDLEAEGGLRSAAPDEHQDDPLDLMTAMRKRSNARGRRKPASRNASSESAKATGATRAVGRAADQELPLDDLEHQPLTVPPPEKPERATGLRESADGDPTPLTTSPQKSDKAQEPAEKPTHRGQSKSRSKRPSGEAGRKTGRPSVPAWDEIMFGSRPGVDRSPP